MRAWTPKQEAFRVWALNRLREHDENAKRGRWTKNESVAACIELWAALDFVLGLGVVDWDARVTRSEKT